jgi:nicotinamide-nucleotide amidase
MSVRAGIVVTGTEVLTGRVADRNGPWLSERLLDLGADVVAIAVVGDRPDDILRALRFLAAEGCALVVTSGGLGPTADDLTAAVVGAFQGREMVLDEALEARIAVILGPLRERWPNLDRDALLASNRKQAIVPAGAEILEPVGTAPGLVVPPVADGGERGAGPTVVVLPGPPRELQPMWLTAVELPSVRAALRGAVVYRRAMLRLFGMPESEIAATLRAAQEAGIELDRLEVTTCLRRGEVEVVTRYEPADEPVYERLAALVRERHGALLFSEDGSSVDEQVFDLLRSASQTIAVAESCTGGLLCARLTERPGSSEVMRGGLVVYSDEAKVELAGVDPALIEAHGAVSREIAEALADGARERLAADVGVGVTGIAGPGGATAGKPVGLVWLSIAGPDGRRLTRSVTLPGGRTDVRDRSTTVALHLVRRLLAAQT